MSKVDPLIIRCFLVELLQGNMDSAPYLEALLKNKLGDGAMSALNNIACYLNFTLAQGPAETNKEIERLKSMIHEDLLRN
jgi:cyanate lyase